MNSQKTLLVLACSAALSACGGSSDSGGNNNPGSDYATCSAPDQNQRFFNYMKTDYFWADQLPEELDPEAFEDVYAVLEELRVPEDTYSYILTEEEYESLFVNAEYVGFGFSQQQVSSDQIKLRFVYQDSPAWDVGMRRGDSLIAVDGESVADLLSRGEYNGIFGDAEAGISREITWRKPNGEEFTELLSKEVVETNTVMGAQVWTINQQPVGYFTLDSFINRTGSDLNQAFNQFEQEDVQQLVIDVRYNSGGLIRYANQTATQTAGTNVQGETFVEYRFNQQNQDQNRTLEFNLVDGVQQLDLDSVVILTTGASCSSSELIINSLQPHIDVTVIGNSTCGKPVGQMPNDLCDKVTFAINFETVNSEGEGRYFDGLAPNCQVDDEIVADWGSFQDPITAAARDYIETGSCPAVAAENLQQSSQLSQQDKVKPPIFYNLKQKRASLQ
ncbi:MAG: S41 family peptidase [Pseudomonadota bacterium]